MVNTEPGRGLGFDDGAAAVHEPAVGVTRAHPVRRGVEIHLNNHPQSPRFGQTHEQAEVLEVELARTRFGRCPIHPTLHGVKAHRFNLVEVLSPARRARPIQRLEHGRARFAASVPNRHRKETGRGGGRCSLSAGRSNSRNKRKRCGHPTELHVKIPKAMRRRRTQKPAAAYRRLCVGLRNKDLESGFPPAGPP